MNQKKAKAIRRAARKIAQELDNAAPTYVIVTPEVITLIGGPRFYQQRIKHRLPKTVDILVWGSTIIRTESGRVRLQELARAERVERLRELARRA